MTIINQKNVSRADWDDMFDIVLAHLIEKLGHRMAYEMLWVLTNIKRPEED